MITLDIDKAKIGPEGAKYLRQNYKLDRRASSIDLMNDNGPSQIRLNLNQKIDDQLLDLVKIDDNLANQLMTQDETIEDHQMLQFKDQQLLKEN